MPAYVTPLVIADTVKGDKGKTPEQTMWKPHKKSWDTWKTITLATVPAINKFKGYLIPGPEILDQSVSGAE